jgi:hypothetical protein
MPKFVVKAKKKVSKGKAKRAALEAEGKRWVDFVISIDSWEMFKAYCGEEKPSVVLIGMIEKAIR